MELLVADECSIAWDEKVGFFIYGGIIVNESEAKPLAEAVINIKDLHSIPKERPIKWSNSGWNGNVPLDTEVHRAVKDSILSVFASSNAKVIVCLSPHEFYHTPTVRGDGVMSMSIDPSTQTRTHEYAFNDLLHKFDSYLGIHKYGIVLADKFGDSVKLHMDSHCKRCFPNGVRNNLTNIVHPVIQLNNEDSYLHQINDVVLGAIYYSLREMELNLLPRIKQNFWNSGGEKPQIIGYGFNVYPLAPRKLSYRRAIANLQQKFTRRVEAV